MSQKSKIFFDFFPMIIVLLGFLCHSKASTADVESFHDNSSDLSLFLEQSRLETSAMSIAQVSLGLWDL